MNAVGRLIRDRLTALSALLLIGVVLASTMVQSGVSAQLSQVLDENWRGAYDILVRPALNQVDTASTQGLVEGNFVAVSGHGGISVEQLNDVRKIPGIDVAAPIGLVGQVGYAAAGPIVNIPDVPAAGTSALPPGPHLYRVTFQLSLSDASGTRVVQQQQLHTVLRRQTDRLEDLVMAADNGAGTSNDPAKGISFTGPTLPKFTSSVIAVDPTAERALLGAKGSFLDPLIAAPDGDRIATNFANSPWLKSLPSKYFAPIGAIEAAATSDDMREAVVVPLIVNETPGADLDMSVKVEESPGTLPKMAESVADVQTVAKGAKFVDLGSSRKNLSSLLVPFATGSLDVPWPGSRGFTENQAYAVAAASVSPVLVGRPNYEIQPAPQESAGIPAFRVAPQGLVSIDGNSQAGQDTDAKAAAVQSYRTPTSATGDPLSLDPTLSVPVSSFSLRNLDFGTDAASYVPYGAYDPAQTTLLPVAQTSASPSVVANPSGLDFISPVPGAITDIQGAQAIRGETPIDAIRVRVAGVTRYTPQAQQKITDIASSIGGTGLTVTVVAGSSPQPVAIYVPDYKVAAEGTTSDLGWVRQDWTTLGASVVVDDTLSSLSTTLLVVTIGVVTVLSLGCVLAGYRRRAVDAHTLHTMGWTRSRIRRWQLAPHVVVLGALLLLTITIGLLTQFPPRTLWAGVCAVAVSAIGLAIVAMTSAHSPTPASRRAARIGVTTPFRLGLRQVLDQPTSAMLRATSWAAVSLGCALTAVVALDASTRVGATRLAGLAVDRTFAGNATLAALTLLAGVALTLLARRIEGRQIAEQRHLLRSMGWARRDLRQHALAATVSAAPAAMILGAGLSLALGRDHRLAALVTAATVGIICVGLSALTDIREQT